MKIIMNENGKIDAVYYNKVLLIEFITILNTI